MSEESKKQIKEIKDVMKTVEGAAEQLQKSLESFGDKELSTKVQRVKESAGEVVKHIEKKSG